MATRVTVAGFPESDFHPPNFSRTPQYLSENFLSKDPMSGVSPLQSQRTGVVGEMGCLVNLLFLIT